MAPLPVAADAPDGIDCASVKLNAYITAREIALVRTARMPRIEYEANPVEWRDRRHDAVTVMQSRFASNVDAAFGYAATRRRNTACLLSIKCVILMSRKYSTVLLR
jgi:hypothetical protein